SGASHETIIFSNMVTAITFPFTFNALVNNSNITGSVYVSGIPAGTVAGTISLIGDAYGTLIINGFANSNVLRVKRTANLVLTVIGSGTINLTEVIYYWYDG